MPEPTYILHIDESIKEPFIGVGGFICKTADIPVIENRWAAVKNEMGLTATDELKWSMGQNHPTRIALSSTKWTQQAERAPAMAKAISEMPLIALCDVLMDKRKGINRGQVDFYRHALTWLLGRFARFLKDEASPDGPHFVVADQPPVTQNLSKKSPLQDDPAYMWVARRHRIAFDVYTDAYQVGFPRYYDGPPPMAQLGLYPSLLVSHADVNPLLQIADILVGATVQCIAENLTGYTVTNRQGSFRPLIPQIVMNDQYGDTCMPILLPKYKGFSEGRAIPYGLVVFPSTTPGWKELREKIEAWR